MNNLTQYGLTMLNSLSSQWCPTVNMRITRVYLIGSKRFFTRTNFIRMNKLRLAQNPFNIPGTVVASEELTLVN